MQIHAIHIDHLLSFNTFAWEGLDPHLNVIVGPNGAGKTNLFHALRAVRDALSPDRAKNTARWAGARHRGTDADTITIALDLQFTTAWEKHLLCAFLAEVLCNQQAIQQTMVSATQNNPTPEGLRQFAAWVQEHLHPESISWLFTGRLVVTHAGRMGWQCQYESRPGEPIFRLDLTNVGTLVGHAEHNSHSATQNWGSLFVAWHNSLTEQERMQLDNRLTGATPEVGFPMPDLSHLPDWISSEQGIALQIEHGMQIVNPETLATYRALSLLTQLSVEPARLFGIRVIFQRLLDQALVFTDNVRLSPQRTFIARDLLTQQADLSNGKQLAQFLFCKKNGDLRDHKQYDCDHKQYQAIQDLFFRMTGRHFDVVLAPVESEGPQQEQLSDVLLELLISSSWGDIPLEFSGAGIGEALFLSAVLAGSTGQVVLLDEPALNIHPTMQPTLLSELQVLAHQSNGEGSQFLMITHVPALVPPDTIDCVSRFELEDGKHSIRRALDVGQIDQSDLVNLRQMLRGNLEARALLFSRAVLLVEGDTELGALPVWCPHLVNQDIAFYSVGGCGNFVLPLKLIRHFVIPWAILGDGELLWDRRQRGRSHGPQDHINNILATCGHLLPSIPENPRRNIQDFAQWRQALEPYGIFTLASSADEGFEKAIRAEIAPDLWGEADTKFGKNKVARGRFIAENSPCPKKVDELIQKVICHLRGQGIDIRTP